MRTALATLALSAGVALAQSERTTMVTDGEGVSVLRETSGLPGLPPVAYTPRAGVLWTYVDANSISESVALGDGGAETWVAHGLNEKRTSKFTTTGAGTPDFVYDMASENPQTIGVDASADTSLCAVLSLPSGGPVSVRAFTDVGGNTPVWTHGFAGSYTNAGRRAVAVSGDGSRVAAIAYDGANSRLVLLDAAGNELGTATIAGFCLGVELSDDGSKILATAGSSARLFDASTMTEVYSLTTSGAGGYHRISGDGTTIAAGGFNIKAARDTGGGWQQVYFANGSNDWFGAGVALSDDGETMFVLSHDYGQGYLPNDHMVIDLVGGTVVSTFSYTGTGGLQNSVVGAEANADGTRFVCASWGDQGNTQPEVRIFDRDLNLIGSIDTPGSPYEIDMTPDGKYVAVGSKAIHANNSGRGGRAYAYEVESPCVADWNGDGVVNTLDFIAYLGDWSAGNANADLTGDGNVNTQDFIAFLNAWSAGC